MHARNALAEAVEIAGRDAWVLEPSPPAVDGPPFFADDPVTTGDLEWQLWLSGHPDQRSWAAERWLVDGRRLGSPPTSLVETRLALHRLAFYVIAPVRKRANGKFGLRWTLGGFGTPFFGDDEQVRVAGTELVVQRGESAAARPITTLTDAAAFVLGTPPDIEWAAQFDVPPAGDADGALHVDPTAAAFLGDWYGFAFSVLEALRADSESVEAGRVQLWPEHFDAALECLPGDRRGVFGASPGDKTSDDPYLYVTSSRVSGVPSDLWNATAFEGAVLPLPVLVDAVDQRATALEFFRSRRAALAS